MLTLAAAGGVVHVKYEGVRRAYVEVAQAQRRRPILHRPLPFMSVCEELPGLGVEVPRQSSRQGRIYEYTLLFALTFI